MRPKPREDHIDFVPIEPAFASWTLAWSPAGALRVWDSPTKSGQEVVSGSPVSWTTYNGLPNQLYVEGITPASARGLTLTLNSPEVSSSCEDEVRVSVVGVAGLAWERNQPGSADLEACANNGGLRIFPGKVSPTDPDAALRAAGRSRRDGDRRRWRV